MHIGTWYVLIACTAITLSLVLSWLFPVMRAVGESIAAAFLLSLILVSLAGGYWEGVAAGAIFLGWMAVSFVYARLRRSNQKPER